MEFEFNKELKAQNFVDIPNIGEFGLECWNDVGQSYYVFVKTILGETYMATCGPVLSDVNELFMGFSISYTHFGYSEMKLAKAINLFLNDKYRAIIGAEVIPLDDCIEQFKDVKKYLTKLAKGVID